MKLEMLLCAKSSRTDGEGRDGFPARNFYGFTPPPARRETRERQKMPMAA